MHREKVAVGERVVVVGMRTLRERRMTMPARDVPSAAAIKVGKAAAAVRHLPKLLVRNGCSSRQCARRVISM
jgi:hypothetical protein